jgi:hypothetical protein
MKCIRDRAILVCIFTFTCLQAFAFGNKPIKAIVKPVDETMAKSLIMSHPANINLKCLKDPNSITPDQSFKISILSKVFYIISAQRETPSNNDLFTCSVLLFDESGAVKSAFDTVGNDERNRPWFCDHIEAMSFKDYYPDGSLQIIALYLSTPPSSERFMLPVIMKLDFDKASLKIDETLTHKVEDADVNTIQEVRSYLRKITVK